MIPSDPTDWFPAPDEPDPMRAAQTGMRPVLPKRFYERAGVEERDGAFLLSLDGRTARTPGRQPITVPSLALAEALAAEWERQEKEIDPAVMPITRIVNSAIDGVAPRLNEVLDDILRYAGSDLIVYRAGEPERLAKAQGASWDPILDWIHEIHGARFMLTQGVMHVSQPLESITAIRRALEEETSPFAVAALHVMTALSGSVLIVLAHARGRLTASEAWDAAHVDERFQESVWGEDHEAMIRKTLREKDFNAASRIYEWTAGAV